MYMAGYLALMMVCDFCSFSQIHALAPPGIVFVRLLLTTQSSTSLTAPYQIQQVLCKSGSYYTTCYGFKHTLAMFMLKGPSGP